MTAIPGTRNTNMIRKAIILLLTLLALALCVGTIKGGLDECTACEFGENRSLWICQSLRGTLLMYWTVGDPSKPDIGWGWLGFGFRRGPMYSQHDNKYSHTVYGVSCPWWFGIVAFGTYPLTAFIRGPVRRWRRRRKGLCIKCGYDLTGNISGVCPECGESCHDRPDAEA